MRNLVKKRKMGRCLLASVLATGAAFGVAGCDVAPPEGGEDVGWQQPEVTPAEPERRTDDAPADTPQEPVQPAEPAYPSTPDS